MLVRDVIVVGAGPAGLVAARELARRGHDVSVLEEHPTVGSPVHCTGILGFEAFDELELPRETICGINQSARFFSAGGNTVLVESPRVQAAVVERGAFDRALADQAISAGAEIETGARLEHLAVDGAAVRVRVVGRDRELRARACVLGVRRQLSLHPCAGIWRAPGVPTERPDRDAVSVRRAPASALRTGTGAWRLRLVCAVPARRRFVRQDRSQLRVAGAGSASRPFWRTWRASTTFRLPSFPSRGSRSCRSGRFTGRSVLGSSS